jgi:hypothetical protein
MIKWFSNFQISNSGTQTPYVYAVVEDNTVKFYGDENKTIFLWEKQYFIPSGVDPYSYLLTLEDFSKYEMVT